MKALGSLLVFNVFYICDVTVTRKRKRKVVCLWWNHSQKSLLSFFIHNLVNRDSIDDIKREDSSSNWSIQKLDFPLIYSNRTATMWRQWMCVPTPNCANWSKTQPTSSCTWLWITLPLRCPSYGKSHVHTTHIMPQNHVGVCGLVVTSNSHLAISQVHELSSQNVHMVPH